MNDRTWGLVLAGGGGKGAYQVGVIKALTERGWQDKIVGVSGSSIGSLNVVLFAQDDVVKMEAIWNEVRPEHIFDVDFSAANLRQELEEKYTAMKEFLCVLKELELENKGTSSNFIDFKMQMLKNHNRAKAISRRIVRWNQSKKDCKNMQYFAILLCYKI